MVNALPASSAAFLKHLLTSVQSFDTAGLAEYLDDVYSGTNENMHLIGKSRRFGRFVHLTLFNANNCTLLKISEMLSFCKKCYGNAARQACGQVSFRQCRFLMSGFTADVSRKVHFLSNHRLPRLVNTPATLLTPFWCFCLAKKKHFGDSTQ